MLILKQAYTQCLTGKQWMWTKNLTSDTSTWLQKANVSNFLTLVRSSIDNSKGLGVILDALVAITTVISSNDLFKNKP